MYSAVDEQLIGWLHSCCTFLQTSGRFLRLVQATAGGEEIHGRSHWQHVSKF